MSTTKPRSSSGLTAPTRSSRPTSSSARRGRSCGVGVVHVDELAVEAARAWLRRHDERAYSFVDATSFEVMRRERSKEALAFDGDFAAAGFVEVRP